jgi:membrane protease YdiL (CAAX protease family)
MDNPKTKIAIFLALTFVLSALTWVPIIRAGDLGLGGGLYILTTMWCPGVAAVLTRLITQRDLRGMGWMPRAPGLLALAYILPLLYAAPVYLIAWGSGLGGFDPGKWVVEPGLTPLTGLLLIATLGALTGLLSATGEEIGWRGLLVPELAKITSFRNTALVSGVIWALWHMPLMIGANYHGEGTPIAYSLLCFAAMVVAMSFVMAWITLKSRSFWPAALLHSTHNLFVQAVFDGATIETPSTNWWTGEFGAGLVVTISIAAFVLVRSSKRIDRSRFEGAAAA